MKALGEEKEERKKEEGRESGDIYNKNIHRGMMEVLTGVVDFVVGGVILGELTRLRSVIDSLHDSLLELLVFTRLLHFYTPFPLITLSRPPIPIYLVIDEC